MSQCRPVDYEESRRYRLLLVSFIIVVIVDIIWPLSVATYQRFIRKVVVLWIDRFASRFSHRSRCVDDLLDF